MRVYMCVCKKRLLCTHHGNKVAATTHYTQQAGLHVFWGKIRSGKMSISCCVQ